MTTKEFLKMKAQVERLQKESDRARGALDQLYKTLKEEFDVDDLRAAKKLLRELEEQSEKASVRFVRAAERFQERWGDELKISS